MLLERLEKRLHPTAMWLLGFDVYLWSARDNVRRVYLAQEL